jgi:hypothetical protein
MRYIKAAHQFILNYHIFQDHIQGIVNADVAMRRTWRIMHSKSWGLPIDLLPLSVDFQILPKA